MWLLIANALISLIVVILLATLSKRVNPVLGGLLRGFPYNPLVIKTMAQQ